MRCRLHRFPLTKAVPLAISRGTTAAVEHLVFSLSEGGITGFGETGGFDAGHRRYETAALAAELEAVIPSLEAAAPEPRQALEPLLASLSRRPAAPWISPFTIGGASGWECPCIGSGVSIPASGPPPA